MEDTSDFRQKAACKCHEQGKLNPANPYSGPYYYAAYRSAKCEAHRRHTSQERRIAFFFVASPCRERYSPELRYKQGGLSSDDPAKIVEAREELDIQRRAIERLAPNDRTIIVQRDLEALSVADLALNRGETECAIRSRHFHARRRLGNDVKYRRMSVA